MMNVADEGGGGWTDESSEGGSNAAGPYVLWGEHARPEKGIAIMVQGACTTTTARARKGP